VTEEDLIILTFFYITSQPIRVAQRITRSATNREIAGSNPVTDNDIFFSSFVDAISGIKVHIF
jgi:hypothetical protein